MDIANVSFVVVARNEESSIVKCLNSLASLQCSDCEFILVDSASTDSTPQIMEEYATKFSENDVYVCSLKGNTNAAMARNCGLKKATKDYIFFTDGDIELNHEFISLGLERLKQGQRTLAVTGQLSEQVYSPGFSEKLYFIKDRYNIQKEEQVYIAGGNIFVKKEIIAKIGIWNEDLTLYEDYDFSLRISKEGDILSLPLPQGLHHTLEYEDRSLRFVAKLYPIYLGYLIRKNIFFYRGLLAILKRTTGVAIGEVYYVLVVLSMIETFEYHNYAAVIFFIVIVFDFVRSLINRKTFIKWILPRLAYPPLVSLGFVGCPFLFRKN